MATIASLNVNMTASTAQLRQGLDRATARNRQFARRNQGIFGGLTRSLGNLRGVFATVFAGAGIAGATRLADEFTSINNLLRSSGLNAEELGRAFMLVQETANNTRSSLEATGRLFAVLTRNSATLGASQDQILTATTAVQQAFALAGASTGEAVGATRQLAQALASGVLRGQELNSVLEQAPEIGLALVRQLGEGGTLGILRQLAMEGRITSQFVFEALLNNAEQLDLRFQQTQQTFSQTAQILRNDLVPVIGNLATQILPPVIVAFTALGNIISIIAPAIPLLAIGGFALLSTVLTGRVVTAIRAVNMNLGAMRVASLTTAAGVQTLRVANAANTVATTNSIFALSTWISRLSLGTLGLRTAVVATNAFTASIRTLGVAFRLLGGPLGLFIQALVTLGAVFGDDIVNYFRGGEDDVPEGFDEIADAIANAENAASSLASEFANGGLMDADTFSATRDEIDGIRILIGEITEAESVRDQMLERINELLANQAITQEQARLAAIRTNEIYAEAINEVGELGQAIETNISDALVEAFETGRFSLRDFTRDVLRSIIRIQAQMAASSIASSLFGGSTGFFSGLFGGARQRGGPVQAGQAYVVGEAGPELFVPNASGNIVANDVVQGGSGGTTNITINAVDTQSFREALARDPRFISNLVQRGQRAQGA